MNNPGGDSNIDYFAVLGIQPNASEIEIEHAYEKRLELLKEAKSALTKDELREIYKDHGSAGVRFFLASIKGRDESFRETARENLPLFIEYCRDQSSSGEPSGATIGGVSGGTHGMGSSSFRVPTVSVKKHDYGQGIFHNDLEELLRRLGIPRERAEILLRLTKVKESLLTQGGSLYWYARCCRCGTSAELGKHSKELTNQELSEFLSHYFDVLGWIDLKTFAGKKTAEKCCPAGRLRSIDDVKSLIFEGHQMMLSDADEHYQGFPNNPRCCQHKHLSVHKMSDLLIQEAEDKQAMIAELELFDDTPDPSITSKTPGKRSCPAGRLIRVLNYLQYFVFKCNNGEFEMFFDDRHPFEAFNIPGIPYSLDERKGSLQEAGDKVGFVIARGREQHNTAPRQGIYYGTLKGCYIGSCVFTGWERWMFIQKEKKK